MAANLTIRRQALTKRVVVGTFLGLVWGASLRAWMVLLALEFGDRSRFTFAGTFGAILFPTALMGALLGAATGAAETSERKQWRWAILSPLLLIPGPIIVTENFFKTLITTGMGGGSIGVALIGLSGGYAFSGFGARWTRWASGFSALFLTIASVFPVYFANQSAAPTTSTSKVFGMLLFVLLMVVLIGGVSTPSRYWFRSQK
jgi:hypothetical protein